MGEILKREEQDGVVIDFSERDATVTERWNRRSRIWGSRMGGRGGGGKCG